MQDRSLTSSPVMMRYPAPAAVLLLTLLSAACSPVSETESRRFHYPLSQLAEFQQGQVSTDLIAVPEGVGLERAGYGWRQVSGKEGAGSCLQLVRPVGQLEIFSADGDLEQIEIEIDAATRLGKQPKIQIRFNGERIDRLPPPDQPTRHRLDLPADLVRTGSNLLEIAQRTGSEADAPDRVCLRRLRTLAASGRPPWPARPDRIGPTTAVEADSYPVEALDLPVAGFFDAVLTIPKGCRLRGGYRFDSHPPRRNQPVYLYVQILDQAGSERTVFHRRLFKTSHREPDLDLDFSRWEGERIRLRIGTTGSGNGVFRWRGLAIEGDEPIPEIATLPPIEPLPAPRSGTLGRPDVLLILLDAARADGFSVFGAPYPTPAAERLAADGTAFADAVSAAPWTGQSVPSILTGLFPDTLGVGPWGSHLASEIPTIAELMAGTGYRTVLWTQHPFYANHQSFRRGFEDYFRAPEGVYEIVPTAAQILADDRPTFALVHIIPPHAPYEPPSPFRGAYSSWYRGDMSVDAKHLNSFQRRRDAAELSADDRRYAVDRYLENVAFADHLVGRILEVLDRTNRYDDTLIVLLSDHGEAFLEHDRFLHTTDVHREMLHVPLIIKWPHGFGDRGAQRDDPVSLVDLVPTLVDGLGLADGAAGFQGRSLLLSPAAGAAGERPIYAMTRGLHDPQRPPHTKLMLQLDGWRALLRVEGDEVRLYRPADDPLETEDLAAAHRLELLRLRQAALAQWYFDRNLLRGETDSELVEPLDPAVEEQLRALGYLN